MFRKILTAAVFGLALCGAAVQAQTDSGATKPPDQKPAQNDKKTSADSERKTNQRPVEPDRKPEPFDRADVKTMAGLCVLLETEKGAIRLEMFPESAPETVRNFLNLVAIGALDNTTFSRVVPGFVIQGGNLWTNENLSTEMKWRSRRKIPDEPNQIKHESGIISMARSDEPNSATTDFFILLREAAYLDGKFAAFGRVTEGMELVRAINEMPVEDEEPKEPVRIKTARTETCPPAGPDKDPGIKETQR